MLPPLGRFAVISSLVLSLFLGTGAVFASEIRLKNGQSYTNATVVRQSRTELEIQVQYGRMTLPLGIVESVDGRKIVATATPTLPPPSPHASVVRSTPAPSRASAIGTPLASPRATAAPRRASTAMEVPAISAGNGFAWRSLLLAIVLAVWGLTVILARRDLRQQVPAARWGWIVTTVLPVVGYLIYRLAGQFDSKWQSFQNPLQRSSFDLLDAEHQPIAIQVGEEITGIENAKEILRAALQQRASDVHIEPLAQECRVRYRIDGTLYPRARLNPDAGLRLISALKSLAQVDITERRRAQDGRFGGRTGDRTVDFRVATTPSVNGEKLVIRILDRNMGLRSLNDLGMSEAMLKDFTRATHSRAGMILATGPTGSGKTSTLYAALSQLDAVQLNLVTIEDPVEYELNGATQIPVNTKAGVTFESGLRSILRQDPDVIFVGEMRDLEAAQIALRSALTGHLVFSSLHTRDAVGTISRLLDMGLDRPLLSSALSVLLAQRLVRVLCRACKQPVQSVGNELEDLGFELPEGTTIYRPAGCRKCEGTGYVGRTGVFEVLIMDDELRAALVNELPEDPFTKLAREKGFRSFREDAAQKVLLGVTSVEEVLKVT